VKTFRADLHIHTCLSACAELDMTPPKIIRKAREKGLQIIAITDHNSAENIPAFNALKYEDIKVFAGMEITTSEEVHVLALFEDYEEIKPLQEIVYETLEGAEFDDRLGYQLVVNEKEEILSFVKRPLIGATKLNVFEIVKLIHRYNGLAIASHIDKEVFSIISQLGFIPEDIIFDGLEVSVYTDINEAEKRFGNLKAPLIRSSDSHHLHEIGRAYTEFFINAPSLEEIRKALRGEDGRRVL
jgi:PHP family Zn ribbon phosphoesterase